MNQPQETQPLHEGDIRIEAGRKWQWTTQRQGPCGHMLAPHWHSMVGSIIRIFPPLQALNITDWWVVICDTAGDVPSSPAYHFPFSGDQAEAEAFSRAEELVLQCNHDGAAH